MSNLQFVIRHQANFLQDKMILVFKSDEAKEYFRQAIPGVRFQDITCEEAEDAARIGVNGQVLSYGYTMKLTKAEMNELSTMNWGRTAELLAEGNERLYQEMNNKKNKEAPH